MRALRQAVTVILGMTFVTAFLLAGTAHASSSACTVKHDGQFCSGYVEFKSYGEHLLVYDEESDGHGVKAYLQEYYDWEWHWVSSNHGVYNGKGANSSPVNANFAVPEGRYVRYQVCLTDGRYGWAFACSAWVEDRA